MTAKNILYTVALFCIFGVSPIGAFAAGMGASPGSSYDATAIHKTGPQRMNGPLNIMHGGTGSPVTEGLTVNLNVDRYLSFDLSGLFVCGADGCMSVDGHDGTLTVPYMMNTSGTFDSTITDNSLILRSSATDASGVPAIAVTSGPTYTTTGRKLFSVQNNNVEKAYVDKDGSIYSFGGTYSGNHLYDTKLTGVSITGRQADGASTIAVRINSGIALANAGAKIASFQNNSVEKMYVDKDGGLQIGVGNTSAAPTCDSASRGKFWYMGGGTGVKDTVQVCAKDAANAYAWRTIY